MGTRDREGEEFRDAQPVTTGEFRDRRHGVLPDLDTHVDLTPLGPTDGRSRSRMAVTITTAPAMVRAERQRLLREALVYMARQFGYVDAEVDVL